MQYIFKKESIPYIALRQHKIIISRYTCASDSALLTIVCVYKSYLLTYLLMVVGWWRGSRVDSVLDSGAVGPGFKWQPRRCRVTVLGKLFTAIVPVFTKQQNW